MSHLVFMSYQLMTMPSVSQIVFNKGLRILTARTERVD